MPARLDIAVQRNETFQTTMIIADDAGAPIDLTGDALLLQVKSKTSGTLIQAADIEVTDPAAGEITITLDASTGTDLHAYGNLLQTYELAYDLVLTDTAGAATVLLAGYVILSRGVSG